MPERTKRPCAAPTCNELVESGYCAKHQRRAAVYDAHRGNAAQRGYDADWKRFRVCFLDRHPFCEDCPPATRLASEVHHVKKVADYPELRLLEANCRALCKPCHSIRTLRGE